MEPDVYTLAPADADGSRWIRRNGVAYVELREARDDRAERVVWALNATGHLATDAEHLARRGGAW